MAAGDALLELTPWGSVIPPYAGENSAHVHDRNYPVIAFDDGGTISQPARDWPGLFMPHHYTDGNIDVHIQWMSEDQTTGDVVWEVGFRRREADVDDIDSSHTYTFTSSTATTASATGEAVVTVVTVTNVDSTTAGDPFVLRIRRDTTSGSDTLTNDAQLEAVYLREAP